jgi:AcrR family transcriptional regulator
MGRAQDDRRVRYTRMVLKQSLISLLERKSIEKITVKEICERAELNRSTFYAHYSDPYDLLRQIEDELLSELDTHLKRLNFISSETETFQLMKTIFEYIVANADLCRALMGEYGDIAFQKQIMMIIQEQRMVEWEHRREFDPEIVQYATLFGVSGSIGVIQKWLQSGMKKTASEMAEFIFKLMYQGLSPYLTTGRDEKSTK